MSERFPVIRLRSNDGFVMGRDGIILSFFMRRSHGEVGPAVWRALQTYLRSIPPRLSWYIDPQGDTRPLDDKGWAFTRERLLGCPWPASSHVELLEFDSEVGGYSFEYEGIWLEAPLFVRKPNATCAVCFSLPTEYLLTHGPVHVRALALELARELPFSFGYASLAVVASGGDWSLVPDESLESLLLRYLGLDVYHLRMTSEVIGTRARGAYWLTFLGQPLLGQLGGPEALRQQLPFEEVSVQPMEGERALLTLGEWPDAIDATKQPAVPHLRALANLLEPFLYDEPPGLFYDYPDSMRRWMRRLCR